MSVTVRRARAEDAETLAAVAAVTFPLACPPHTTAESTAAFIAEHLGVDSFDRYLADPDRELYLAEEDGEVAGYTMLVHTEPTDEEVVAAITAHPTTELSKCYVLPGHHGAGVASALMEASVGAAREQGSAGMWLGVNQLNGRANAFYAKHGFVEVGTKHFRVGANIEDDFVRELVFDGTSIGGS